ncbi:hypothetical protein FACS189462_2810 [Spirochaetia bacterium]|nr:hypothetical protein FACS189462_2810 [Spirochaetia bacterium]
MKLNSESIEFARNHINKFYDSDFFPKLNEFAVINNKWKEIRKYLLSLEIDKFAPEFPIVRAAPKNDGSFRIVHQLDSINSLIYTALGFMLAENIEKYRMPYDKQKVFSYRFSPTQDGNFFESGNKYLDYIERTRELAESNSYILITDITGFYNHIYIHRIQNVIEGCNSSLTDLSKTIEAYLMRLNSSSSIGIPVGPVASIIIAETLMIDIDNFLEQKGEEFIRYVDDIKIFDNSIPHLTSILHDLTEYLYNYHRLFLSSAKTKIIESCEYLTENTQMPEKIEVQKIHEKLNLVNINVNLASSYENIEPYENIEELPPEDKIRVQAEVLQDVFRQIIGMGKLDLGLSRHIIRRSKKLRSRAIYNELLNNFDFFVPIIRDVALYFEAVANNKVIENTMEKFERIVSGSRFITVPFVRDWVAYILSRNDVFQKSDIIKHFLLIQPGFRYKLMAQKKFHGLSWLRSQRTEYSSLTSMEKREYLIACSILPKTEKKAWIATLPEATTILEKTTIAYCLGQQKQHGETILENDMTDTIRHDQFDAMPYLMYNLSEEEQCAYILIIAVSIVPTMTKHR